MWVLLLLTTLLYGLYYVYRYIYMRVLPGPFVFPFLGNSPQQFFALRDGRFFQYMDSLYAMSKARGANGSFCLWNPGRSGELVAIVDVKDVKYVLVDAFDTFGKPPDLRDAFGDIIGDGIFTTDHVTGDWEPQRKTLSHLFKVRSLQAMHTVFSRHAHHLCAKLDEAARQGTVVDMQRLMASYTLGSGLESFFGVQAFDQAQFSGFFRFIDPLWKLKRFLGVGKREQQMVISSSFIRAFADQILA
jgi:cytochrome P450